MAVDATIGEIPAGDISFLPVTEKRRDVLPCFPAVNATREHGSLVEIMKFFKGISIFYDVIYVL